MSVNVPQFLGYYRDNRILLNNIVSDNQTIKITRTQKAWVNVKKQAKKINSAFSDAVDAEKAVRKGDQITAGNKLSSANNAIDDLDPNVCDTYVGSPGASYQRRINNANELKDLIEELQGLGGILL